MSVVVFNAVVATIEITTCHRTLVIFSDINYIFEGRRIDVTLFLIAKLDAVDSR